MSKTQKLFFKQGLIDGAWHNDIIIILEGEKISKIQLAALEDDADALFDCLLPGMANLHSHSFQRAMATLGEHSAGHDTFWTWRDKMYKLSLTISPEELLIVTKMLYIELLEAGYTRVGEFHYLHNNCQGQAYQDISELSNQIISASLDAGINLTLLPVYYNLADFGSSDTNIEQRRFKLNLDSYYKLFSKLQTELAEIPDAKLGVAPHSLRAAKSADICELNKLAGERPFHIHIAEQQKEVDACLNFSGLRPLELLAKTIELSAKCCLVHATHLNPEEARIIEQSKATIGLCPITEANLGDGIFPSQLFNLEQINFGIGTDSNIKPSLARELELLEYSQRLYLKKRNVFSNGKHSTGRILFDKAIKGGAQALDYNSTIKVGAYANFISLDLSQVPWAKGDLILDNFIFGGVTKPSSVWVKGKMLVKDGSHHLRQSVESQFNSTMKEIVARL